MCHDRKFDTRVDDHMALVLGHFNLVAPGLQI